MYASNFFMTEYSAKQMYVEVTVIDNSWNPTLSMSYVWDKVH